MSENEKGQTIQREPYALIVEWADPKRNAEDEDAPFCFGPYSTLEQVQAAVRLVEAYQKADADPPEERLKWRIGTYKPPSLLRMFLFL